jgi:hypothetical protein
VADDDDQIVIRFVVDPVFRMRRERLEQAGFPDFPALQLALSSCDYHDAIRSFQNGATVDQVLDIYLDY